MHRSSSTPHAAAGDSRWKPILAALLAAAATLALPACSTSYDRSITLSWPDGQVIAQGDESGHSATPPTEERFFAFPGGALAVDITANKGPVEVRVDPKATTVRVLATVDVSDDVEKEQRQRVADAVSVWAHLEPPVAPVESGEESDHHPTGPAGPGSVLRIGAESARPESGDHTVALKVIVPRCDGLLVRSVEGGVTIVGVSGAVQVETRKGFIELRTAQKLDAPVNLSTEEGSVYFQAALGTQGRFDMRTNDGMAAMTSHEPASQAFATDKTYRVTLNGGVNPIVLTTGKGDVRAWIIERPEQHVRLIK